jgi:hypothetical protein
VPARRRRVSGPTIVVKYDCIVGARAFLVCGSYEEQQRIAVEVKPGDVVAEMLDAVYDLFDELQEARGARR